MTCNQKKQNKKNPGIYSIVHNFRSEHSILIIQKAQNVEMFKFSYHLLISMFYVQINHGPALKFTPFQKVASFGNIDEGELDLQLNGKTRNLNCVPLLS